MKILKTIKSCLWLIFAILIIGVCLIIWQSYRFWFQSPKSDAVAKEFVIKEGSSFSQISRDLLDQDLIANKFWFGLYARVDGSARDIQASTFEIQPGMNYSALINLLVRAESDEISITIPEGYTLKQIGEVVTKNFDVTEAEWGMLTGMESTFEDHEFIIAADKPENVDLEGYLFPDTYRFFKDATGEEIVKKMIDNTQQRVESIDGELPEDMTWHEVITLASIIEREVMTDEDRKLVADLFERRLEIGMALQADSTVNYITGNDTPAISLTDRDISSPYNTYKNPGLPPGPICNPGLAAIDAVIHPTPNKYLYFLTTPEGEVIYATSYNEHLSNKQKYLR